MPKQVDLATLYEHRASIYNASLPWQEVSHIDMVARRAEWMEAFEMLAVRRAELAEQFGATLNRDEFYSWDKNNGGARDIAVIDSTHNTMTGRMRDEGHELSMEESRHVYYERSVEIQEYVHAQIAKNKEQSQGIEVGIGVEREHKAEAPAFRNDSEKTPDIEQLAELRYSQNDAFSLSDLLRYQEQTMREEWQRDLESGRHNEHDLESYFAGRIDQHNTLIQMAVEAHPELQQTLPPAINYVALRDELQHHIEAAKDQQVSIQPELAAAGSGISI